MHYLVDALLLLAVAVVLVPLFQYLRLGAVLGFLAAGALVGPSGFGVVAKVDDLRHFSELGVVFLLFIIGMELKPSRLWRLRSSVFGLGTLQLLVTGAALVPAAILAGYGVDAALLIGPGLALSSTAFVLQLLAERRELGSQVGRTTFSVLLLQDLAVVPLLALIPLLARPDGSIGGDVGLAFLETAAILGLVYLVGRYLLKPVLHLVARHGTPEIFAASAVLLVLGSALLLETAGLSMAMGAFIAGLLIADSEYRHQIHADIQPFRGFLLGLFFMAVGMSVELNALLTEPARFLAGLALLLTVKAAAMFLLGRVFGLDSRGAARTALLLAQSGEFGFVLFGVATAAGLLTAGQFGELAMLIALSMAATPLLAIVSDRLRATGRGGEAEPSRPPEPDEEGPRVIIAGFGRVGRRIARILHRAGVSCRAVDRDPEKVRAGRLEGLPVYYGDASRADVLRTIGAPGARLLLVTLDSPEAAEQLVGVTRSRYPDLPIYARAHDSEVCGHLVGLGATGVVSENLESSLQLARMALDLCGTAPEERETLVEDCRKEHYSCQLRPPENARRETVS